MTAMTPPRPHRLLWPVLAVILVISWSAGFVGLRQASEAAPVFLILFWRMALAGVLLLPVALLSGPWPRGRALRDQAVFGLLGMFLYLGGFALAIEARVPTGLVALIADLVPLAVAALSQPVLGERLSGRQWAGTGIGALGVALVAVDGLTFGTAPAGAYALPVAAMLCFALVTVLQKRRGAIHMPIAQSLCIQCLTAAVPFAALAGWQGGLAPPMQADFVQGLLWLVFVATFLCYSVYYLCLRLYPPARVAAVVYLSPPVTMLWAWAMFGEPLSAGMGLGLAVTLAGVWMAAAGPSAARTA